MIQIQIRDTLVDIVEKIESQKTGDIILDFPLGHPILHNYVSLKVLKSKTKNRRFVIATSDKIGRKIGKSLGIEYSLIKSKSFLKQNSQTELMKHNYSFLGYLKFQIRLYKNELFSRLETNSKFHTISKYSHKYTEKNSLYIFFIILFFSLVLFGFIYYFIVSQTVIYITPERVIRTEAHNFIFKENIENNILGNNNYIKIRVLNEKIQNQETYGSTGIKAENSQNAEGEIIIYNTYAEPQDLIAGTRFQTPDGLLFEITKGVSIPGSVRDNFGNISPGQIKVNAQSKQKDTAGKLTGSRGNIGEGVPLTLPGLDADSQKMIFAETVGIFTGGQDSFQKVVTEDDIKKALSLFEEKLKSVALTTIKKNIDELNNVNGTNFDILSGGKSIVYQTPISILETGVSAGDIQDNFSVSGSIEVSAYIYNTSNIVQKLRTILSEKTLKGIEKVSKIDTSSLRMSQLLYAQEANINDPNDTSDDTDFELKATFEIESVFVHDFLSLENNYTNLLKSKIRGLSKTEAEKILLNDPKVSNVEIRIRPFFVKNITNISNNIIFKIR